MDKYKILSELQLLTSTMTEDLEYLVYLLLKDGTYFTEKKEDKYVQCEQARKEEVSLVEWFNSLEEV